MSAAPAVARSVLQPPLNLSCSRLGPALAFPPSDNATIIFTAARRKHLLFTMSRAHQLFCTSSSLRCSVRADMPQGPRPQTSAASLVRLTSAIRPLPANSSQLIRARRNAHVISNSPTAFISQDERCQGFQTVMRSRHQALFLRSRTPHIPFFSLLRVPSGSTLPRFDVVLHPPLICAATSLVATKSCNFLIGPRTPLPSLAQNCLLQRILDPPSAPSPRSIPQSRLYLLAWCDIWCGPSCALQCASRVLAALRL